MKRQISWAVVMSIGFASAASASSQTEQPLGDTHQANQESSQSGFDLNAGVALVSTDGSRSSHRPMALFQPEEGQATGVGGQESVAPAKAGIGAGDSTGTNPIAFTYDLRLYHEYQTLSTAGGGDQHVSTVEFRAPLMDGKFQFRTRLRYNMLNADVTGNGRDDVDESGFGDMDFRFLTVPYVNMQKKFAFAVGLEVFLDTASDEALGSGATSLGPQVFAVFFKPFDSRIVSLIAPAYQHRISIEGNDVDQSLIDVFVLATSKNKDFWVLLDPQVIIDHENDKEFMLVDTEMGFMLDPFLDTKGRSVYIRPSVGIGRDRPYEQSFEFGLKHVW